MFLKGLWLTLFPDRSPPPDFPGLPGTYVEIMRDEVVLDSKKSGLCGATHKKIRKHIL